MSDDSDARVPQELWKNDGEPPKLQDVLSRVGGLLKDLGYEKSLSALEKEGKKKGVSLEGQTSGDGKELLSIWAKANAAAQVPNPDDSSDRSSSEESDESESEAEGGASVDDSSSSEDSSSSSDSDSSSDSSSDSDVPAKAGQKRKRAASSSSDSSSSSSSESDSDSSSSSDSSSEDERPAKKAKLSKKGKSDTSSSDSSSSDSSSSDSDAAKTKGKKKAVPSASSASSSSDSSSSEEEDSSSSARRPSSPSPAPRPKKAKAAKKKAEALAPLAVPTDAKAKKAGSSSSSATLDAENSNDNSNDNDPEASNTSMHPDRANLLAPQPAAQSQQGAYGKKQAVPFSRIPKDQQVDSRFGSNKYVSYDYADRAYKDLSVTKGKGFTKEKNKKKRGTSSTGKSAEQRDWERQARYDLSLSPPSGSMSLGDDFSNNDNALGSKEDTFAFMSGCGFNPMSGSYRGGAIDLSAKGIKFED